MPDSNPETQTESRSSKKISRRDFLKLAGLGMGAVSLNIIKDAIDVTKRLSTLKSLIDATANIWQPKVVELGIDSLENPAVIESVLGNSAGSLEDLALHDHRAEGAPKIEKNPSYKPMAEIIGEVLDKRRNEGKPIIYQRVDGYESLPYYQDKLRKMASDPTNRDRSPIEADKLRANSYILGYMPETLDQIFKNSTDFFPKEVRVAWEISDKNFISASDLARYKSGFLDRINEDLVKGNRILQGEEYFTYIRQIIGTYLQDIRQNVETLVTQTGAPISAGEIFSYCLDRNNGSINKSLMDTTIFLKYMARNDITLHTFNPLITNPLGMEDNEDWFKANIKDEYGKVGNYSQLPHQTYPYHGLLSIYPDAVYPEVDKDLHLLNQIGKPYHVWNIATLLSALPPTMIQTGVAYRQFTTFNLQGPVKTAADFQVALELRGLDQSFMGFSA